LPVVSAVVNLVYETLFLVVKYLSLISRCLSLKLEIYRSFWRFYRSNSSHGQVNLMNQIKS